MNPVVGVLSWNLHLLTPVRYGIFWVDIEKKICWWIVQVPRGKLGLCLWCGAPRQLWFQSLDHLTVRKTMENTLQNLWKLIGWAVFSKMLVHQRRIASGPDVNEKWGLSNWTYASTEKKITRMMAQTNQQKKTFTAPGETRTLFPHGSVYQVWPSIIQVILNIFLWRKYTWHDCSNLKRWDALRVYKVDEEISIQTAD